MAAQPIPREDRFLGPYEIVRELGRGASAAVYEARDRNTGERVALKVLWGRLAPGEKAIEQFAQEAKILRALNHPQIVASRSPLLSDRGRHFFAMEYVDGKTLADFLQARGRLAAPAAVQIALQILEGLDVAHWAGVLHRDLKPSNVVLRKGDAGVLVRIVDFGVAAATVPVDPTSAEGTVGTAYYLPPELCRGEPAAKASDLYMVGVILYEMVEGHPPFQADNLLSMMRAHVEDPVPPFSPPWGPDAEPLHAIVVRAMAKDPAERYGSAKEMAQALLGLASAAQPVPWDSLWTGSDAGSVIPKEVEDLLSELGEAVVCHACGARTQEGSERCVHCKARTAESLFPRRFVPWDAFERTLGIAAATAGFLAVALPWKGAVVAASLAAITVMDARLYFARAYGKGTARGVRDQIVTHLGRASCLSTALGLAVLALAVKALSNLHGSLRVVPWILAAGWGFFLALHWTVARTAVRGTLESLRRRSREGWSVEGSSGRDLPFAELVSAAQAQVLAPGARVSGPATGGRWVRASRVPALAGAFGRCHVCAERIPCNTRAQFCPKCRSPLFWVEPEGLGLPRWVLRPAPLSFLKLQAFAAAAMAFTWAVWSRFQY